MEHCLPLDRHPRREEILLAIGEHDSGWEETDAAPSVDPATGGVADFIKVPVSVRQGVWPRAIARLAGEPWAAALVAHHAWFVYERFRTSADPEWAAFFAEMAAARDARLESLRLPFDELESDYAFLRLGDLISLAFCTQAPEPSRYGPWTVQADGARVVVGSAPFSGVVSFEVQAREIHAGPFRSDDELRAAVGAAVTTTLRGEVVAGPN